MSSRCIRVVHLLVVALLAAVPVVAVRGWQAKPPKQIVLIAGRPSHPPRMHEFRAGVLLFQKALAATPGVTVQVHFNGWPTKTVDGQVVDDNAALDSADAVLIYADGGR